MTLPVYVVGGEQEGGRVILLCAPCLGVGTQVGVTVCPWTLEFHGFAVHMLSSFHLLDTDDYMAIGDSRAMNGKHIIILFSV